MVVRFDARMRTGKRAVAVAASWNGAAMPRWAVRLRQHGRRNKDQTKNGRLFIVLTLFLALLAPASLVGGRAIIEPMLRAAAEAEHEANRVGDIVFAMPDGAFCRHLSFDNRTAELSGSAVSRCPQANPHVREWSRASPGFAWGAH
jgi:hypothetical protein